MNSPDRSGITVNDRSYITTWDTINHRATASMFAAACVTFLPRSSASRQLGPKRIKRAVALGNIELGLNRPRSQILRNGVPHVQL
jgi:hypothetical protein